jgi:hypothetical protein
VFLLATSAPAQVPNQVPFQGLLLDAGGEPVNASVDLDFELFDALTTGTSLWSESHLGVIVVDGVYSVDLGSITPMTSMVLAGGVAFLEITVSGEMLVPRQQLLSVPYALVSEATESVGEISATLVEQMFASFPFDGEEPGNLDPEEGSGDTDGDGIPNFIDPDNDGDGISDATELSLGRPINLANPTITDVMPAAIQSFANTTLVVSGQGLDTVMSVTFGTETPDPFALSSTSLSVNVTAETLSPSESLIVTRANGESAASSPITIQAVGPTIDSISPGFARSDESTVLTITGSGFYAGTTVQVGTQNLIPSAISDTEMTVHLAEEPVGLVILTVTHPNTLVANRSYPIIGSEARLVFVTSTTTTGGVGSIDIAHSICQGEADLAFLSGTYRAWLSVSSASPETESPATTFPMDVGPYLRTDGAIVAVDWVDLTGGTLLAPIDVTADGDVVIDPEMAWTGTNADGTAAASVLQTCQEWSTESGQGERGLITSTTSTWTESPSIVGCSLPGRLYCFQQ